VCGKQALRLLDFETAQTVVVRLLMNAMEMLLEARYSDQCYNLGLGGCKHAKTKHAKAVGQGDQAPRRPDPREPWTRWIRRLRTGSHLSHLSQPRVRRYIDRLMERPQGPNICSSSRDTSSRSSCVRSNVKIARQNNTPLIQVL
jgi:hypothetical protein